MGGERLDLASSRRNVLRERKLRCGPKKDEPGGGTRVLFFWIANICTWLLAAAVVSGAENGVEIPLKTYIAGLRLVEVKIEGSTGQFIFDSAGGLSLITPEFSRALGFEPFGRLTAFKHTGERIQFQRIPARRLSVGGVRMRQTELVLFDVMKLLEGAPVVQGVIALNTFDGAAVTIDFAKSRLILENKDSLGRRVKEMKPLRIRAARQSGGAALDVFVAVDSPHSTLWLELDSGNAGPVLVSPHAAEQLGLKLDGETTAATLRLSPEMEYSCTVASKETIYDGVLNATFFQQHIVTLDLRNMRAWARRNAHSPNPGRARLNRGTVRPLCFAPGWRSESGDPPLQFAGVR